MTSRAAALPPHLSGTAVSAAADSELSEPERARVLSHLSRCAACRGRLVTEQATKDLVHSLGLGAPRPPADLNRTLLSLGERTDGPDALMRPQLPTQGRTQLRTQGRPQLRTQGRTQSRRARSGTVGVLSAVGLTLGLAAAAVVPVAAGPTPAAVGTAASPPVGGRPPSAGQQSGPRVAAVALPAAFTSGGGPVAPVRGTAPDADRADAPAATRAALLVVVEIVLARLETSTGR